MTDQVLSERIADSVMDGLLSRQVNRQELVAAVAATLQAAGAAEPVGSVHKDTLAMLPSVRSWESGARLHSAAKAAHDSNYVLVYTHPQPAPAGDAGALAELAYSIGKRVPAYGEGGDPVMLYPKQLVQFVAALAQGEPK